MTKLIACISAYNEEPQMIKCLDSVKDFIDGVCLVDGKFFGYPNKKIYSEDKTLQITDSWCKDNDKEFTFIQYADYRQKNKRTQYLQNPCSNPDSDTWLFILDPDNIFEDLGGFREDFLKYAGDPKNKFLSILCSEEQLFGKARSDTKKALLLRYEAGLKYQPNHWVVADKDNKLYCATNQSNSHVLPGKIFNRPLDRPGWKRKWERSIYRAIRLLASPSRWGNNFYETGNDCKAEYIDSPESLERFEKQLQRRMDTLIYDLDIGMMSSLQWVKDGSLMSPPTLGEMQRGQLLGLLIVFGLCPNPYSGEVVDED